MFCKKSRMEVEPQLDQKKAELKAFLRDFLSGSGCRIAFSKKILTASDRAIAWDSSLEQKLSLWRKHLEGTSTAFFFEPEHLIRAKKASFKRQNEWLGGRLALLEVLTELEGQSGKTASHGPGTPRPYLLSLAHSGETVLAIGVDVLESKLAGVGVDLEQSSRQINPAIRDKILTASEEQFALDLLEVWTIKEACFKASLGLAQGVVSHYQVTDFDRVQKKGWARSSQEAGQIQFALYRSDEEIVALALRHQLK